MNNFLDIAMSIVEAEGFSSLTMPKVADRADVAVGGLYRYFDSKNVLLCRLQVRCAEAFIEFLVPVTDRVKGQPALQRARAYALAWSEFGNSDPIKHAMLDQSLSNPDAELTDTDALAVDKALRPALEYVADALKEAQKNGTLEPGDTWLRTYALWAAMHGVGHFEKRDRFLPEALHTTNVRELLLDSLLIGWGAKLSPA